MTVSSEAQQKNKIPWLLPLSELDHAPVGGMQYNEAYFQVFVRVSKHLWFCSVRGEKKNVRPESKTENCTIIKCSFVIFAD